MRIRLFALVSVIILAAVSAPAIARAPLKVWPNAKSQAVTKAPARSTLGTPPKLPDAPVADPSNFHGSQAQASSTSIDLSWVDNSNNEDHFHICRKMNHAANYDSSSIVELPANTTKFHVTGLEPETLYTFGLAASDGSYWSFMVETDVTTNPRPVTALKAVALSAKKVQLTWTNNSKTAELIMIERSTGTSNVFQKIFQTQPISLSSYTDASVAAGSKYVYRLVVLKLPFNASDYTFSSAVTTPAN